MVLVNIPEQLPHTIYTGVDHVLMEAVEQGVDYSAAILVILS